jgi:predicted dehydrogenase
MSKFGILGSGFGLYGYLPALIDGCSHYVVLPERYRKSFIERPELAQYSSSIDWKTDEEAVLDCVDGIVLALSPVIQREILHKCLTRSSIRSLFLEKPLAHTPDVATEIYNELIRSRKVFRLGYTFRYTPWGKELLNTFITAKKASGSFFIHWSFYAHHYRYEMYKWKRFHNQGGGAIRFYGIQIIALLAEIGYLDVKISRSFGVNLNESEKWVAVVSGLGLPDCKIVVDTKSSVNKFQIGLNIYSSKELPMKYSVNLSDPFELENRTYQLDRTDRRVLILSQLCNSLCEDNTSIYEFYKATIKLWRIIEEKTNFE